MMVENALTLIQDAGKTTDTARRQGMGLVILQALRYHIERGDKDRTDAALELLKDYIEHSAFDGPPF